MATYHCSIKHGNGDKVLPHFDYINRQNKYDKKQDLIHTASGNMPSCVLDAKEFWTKCAEKDKRAYREIEFALPNELTREEQIQLVEEYIQEVIPNNPYTYAIHEPESAIHGIKNPHVHLMFSERLLTEDVKDLDKETFFKKRGINRIGETYGGAIKDRSWAGKGRTTKFYQVRKSLADLMNKKFKEKGMSERVSHESLVEQKSKHLMKGNIEKANTITVENPIRLSPSTFYENLDTIKSSIHSEDPLDIHIDPAVNVRILQEKQRIAAQQKKEILKEYHQTLEPTEAEYKEALLAAKSEIIQLQEQYKSPFYIVKDKLNTFNNREKAADKHLTTFKELVALQYAKHEVNQELIKTLPIKESITDLLINKAILEKQYNKMVSLSRSDYYNKWSQYYIDKNTNKEYSKIINQIRSKESLLLYAKKQPNKAIDIETIKQDLAVLNEKKKVMYKEHIKEDVLTSFDYRYMLVLKQKEQLQKAMDKTDELVSVLKNMVSDKEYKELADKATKKQSVYYKHQANKDKIDKNVFKELVMFKDTIMPKTVLSPRKLKESKKRINRLLKLKSIKKPTTAMGQNLLSMIEAKEVQLSAAHISTRPYESERY